MKIPIIVNAGQFDWKNDPAQAADSIYYWGSLFKQKDETSMFRMLEEVVDQLVSKGWLDLPENDWPLLKQRVLKQWKRSK